MPVNITLPQSQNGHEPYVYNNRLINRITFFGDSAIPEESPIYQSVWQAAKVMAQNNYAVVNGGGPGIMKAATDGAAAGNGKTIAVYWQPKLASFFEGKNLANVTDESDTASNYVVRTFGLIEKGDAYVICKGGTGTISEFGLVWCLAKLYYGCHKPVILYGDFWDPMIEGMIASMNLDEVELGVLQRANTPEELLKIIQEHEQKIQHCRTKVFEGDESAFLLGSHNATSTTKHYDQQAATYHSKYAGKLVAHEQLEEFKKMVNPPAKVLDVGSGPGLDAKFLTEFYNVTSIEPSKRMAEIAKYEAPNAELIQTSIEHFEMEPGKYKGIWARDSLHHVAGEDMDAVFNKLSDGLVEGGILYVIVREGQGEEVERDIHSHYTTERFYHLFTKEELIERAAKVGLEPVRVDLTQRSHTWLVGVFKKK